MTRFPLDGIVGEEGTDIAARSGRRWIIDPIDGTRDYIRATGLWAVLVALEEISTGKILVGVVYFPALGQTYTAVTGQGAYHDGSPIGVSTVATWEDAVVHVNNLMLMEAAPYGRDLLSWLSGCLGVRNLGGAMDAMLIASGKADVWLDPIAKPWDLAPLKLIIEEAGGRFHDNAGVAGIYGGNAVAYTPRLAARVKSLCRGE